MTIPNARLAALGALLAVGLLAGRSAPGRAAEPVKLTIQGHRFVPDHVEVPAGVRFRIEVTNRDPSVEEFESPELRIEKIVVGGGTISVFAGPLTPGTYPFFGDYHRDQAKGAVVATAKE